MKSNYHTGRKRDNCYFCHARGTEEHHIIPQRFDGPDDSKNIVGVCSLCHKKLERLYDRSFYEWFGIDDAKGERLFHRQCCYKGCKNGVTRVLKNRSKEGVSVCEDHAWKIADDAVDKLTLKSVDLPPREERVAKKLEEITEEKSGEVEQEE